MSAWSSDVCSSDLRYCPAAPRRARGHDTSSSSRPRKAPAGLPRSAGGRCRQWWPAGAADRWRSFLAGLPVGQRDERRLEAVAGAGIPGGAMHAADKVESSGIDMQLVVDRLVADMQVQDFAHDDGAVKRQVHGAVGAAFEADR